MNKINVLMAIDHVDYDGQLHGGGRCFSNIISRINLNRFKIIARVLRRASSVKQLVGGVGVSIRSLARHRLDPRTLLDLIRTIRAENIHLLHLHGFGSQTFGRMAAALTGVPAIIHGHGLDYYPSGFQKLMDRLLSRFTCLAITVSNSVKEDYVLRRQIDPGLVLVMPNGIPIEKFTPVHEQNIQELKRSLDIPFDHYVVGTVTRLREEKGNRYLLEAIAQVVGVISNVTLLIVGDGPLREELHQLAYRSGIAGCVIFAGFHQDVANMLSIFDVMVIASLSEGQSLALLEAMAMEKAVVATNVGGISEILRDGETGLLVPPQDPRTMAAKIIYLLQHGQERARLGSKACMESAKFSLDRYVKDLEGVYEDVVENG